MVTNWTTSGNSHFIFSYPTARKTNAIRACRHKLNSNIWYYRLYLQCVLNKQTRSWSLSPCNTTNCAMQCIRAQLSNNAKVLANTRRCSFGFFQRQSYIGDTLPLTRPSSLLKKYFYWREQLILFEGALAGIWLYV